MKVNMHIQRLVLDGLPVSHHQQPLLQAAVEGELTRLFTGGGPGNGLLSGGAVSYIPANDIQPAKESDPVHLGQQIARTVYEGVSR